MYKNHQFYLGYVIWFNSKDGYGFLKVKDEPDVQFRIEYGGFPRLIKGKLVVQFDYGQFAAPKAGTPILFEAELMPKGPHAFAWAFWEAAAHLMIQEWVRTHDRCSCGHLILEHTSYGSCIHCICHARASLNSKKNFTDDPFMDESFLKALEPYKKKFCPECGNETNGNGDIEECPSCGWGTEAWDHRYDAKFLVATRF